MANIGYYFKVLKGASFQKLSEAVNRVHERCGKNKLAIMLDMAWCAVRYGAGYYDYLIFAFYDLSAKQRKTYVTRFISKKLNLFMNDEAYVDMVDNKDMFYTNYKQYIGREFLSIPDSTVEDLAKFIEGKDRIFCKMRALECGIGCERLNVADFESVETLWKYLTEKGLNTIEDVIVCHPDVRKLYDNAVNSMRIITMLDKDQKAHCLYAVQKIGLNGSIIDNNCMFAPVDIETGRILYPAQSGDTALGILYEEHPNTHVKIQGYQLPFVKEAVAMCLEAATVIPQVRYMGWDVAVTETGPVIIEGNTYNAHDFWQLPPHTPDKIGMLPKIKEIVPEFKY